MIYTYLDKNIKGINSRELTQSVDCKYLESTTKHLPQDASLAVLHGTLRGMGDIAKECIKRNVPWMYMDNGYLGKYKRVTMNGTAPTTFRPGKSFEHGTQLLPWRGGQGSSILVLPPSPPYMDTFNQRDFLNFIANNVNIYTDKNIIVRAKPAKGRLARPLQEQLDNAYCVVTWGSAIALEATRQGIPTISLGWCPAKMASKKLEDLETDAMKIEPERMSIFDNITWSSFDRNELPYAWATIMENSKCQQI